MINLKIKISDILPQNRVIKNNKKQSKKIEFYYNPQKIIAFKFDKTGNLIEVLKDKK